MPARIAASMEKFANRDSWKNLPLPPQRARLNVERAFTEREYAVLRRGLIPVTMEDTWFIFMEGDTLFFHRSWTGACIYEVHLDPQHRIVEAWVNRDFGQYKATDDEYDGKLLFFVMDDLLHRQQPPFAG